MRFVRCYDELVNIYENIFEEMEQKQPAGGVFVALGRLGLEAAEKAKERSAKRAKETLEKRPFYANYPRAQKAEEVKERIAQEGYKSEVRIEVPPPEVDADFSVPIFSLAKEKGVPPPKIVEAIIKLKPIRGARFEGKNGYVNLILDQAALASSTLHNIFSLGDLYGSSRDGAGKTMVIEYSSPNVAKPMSVGHLRSTIIGESLRRLYEFQGYTALSVNHLGDFGTQFGKLIVAYELWLDKTAFQKDPLKEMLRLYVKFHQEEEKDATLKDRARETFRKLEEGNEELAKLWLSFCRASAEEFERVYKELGLDFDLTLGESYYHRKTRAVVERCVREGIAVRNEDGSVAVEPEEKDLPSFLLEKKDGSSLYAARDVATAEFRIAKFLPEKLVYVVGNEQTLHFNQVFYTLARLGYGMEKFRHDGFGLVLLPEGKMSTRAGRMVLLEDVLSEAKQRAYDIVTKKNAELPEEEKKEIARAVGVGALVYSDLAQGREKDVSFSWEKALSLEGASAPYIQYAYARAASILRKSDEEPNATDLKGIVIGTEQEKKLVRRLALFPETAREAAQSDHPHIVATYLNALVQDFNRFYTQNPVLSAEGNVRTTRLALVGATAQVLKNGLFLLGIKAPERM